MAPINSEEEIGLLGKIEEVKKKKGGVDPTIIIYRGENQPIRIVLRSVETPVIVGDYVSVSVSDSDFMRIKKVFQKFDQPNIPMSRSFEPREGGRAHSEMEYYNSFEIIEMFIEDIYSVKNFFRRSLNSRFSAIIPLKNLHAIVFSKWQQDPSVLERGPHTSVFPFIDKMKWFSTEEFEQNILPFLEAAFLWQENKKLERTTSQFRAAVSQRILEGDQSALYGYLSEVYMSGLYIFSGWKDLNYIDKLNISRFKKHGDWIFNSAELGILGIECKDKRQTAQGQKQVRLLDIQNLVDSAIKKLEQEEGIQKKMLWVNITNVKDYSKPLLSELGVIEQHEPRDTVDGVLKPCFSLCNKDGAIDCVVFAWREKIIGDNGYDYIQRYVITQETNYAAYLPKIQPLFHLSPGKHFFVRNYVFPELTSGGFGPEETAP